MTDRDAILRGELAGRRLWIGLPGPDLTAEDRRHLETIRPGGLLVFRRNIRDLARFRRFVAEVRDLLGPKLHIAVDQEGGSVVRFYRELTVFPGNAALGRIAQEDLTAAEDLAYRQGRASGAELRDLGITVNLAPVVDVLDAASRGTGTRSFGDDFERAVVLGRAIVRGHREAGVRCCFKHFPGLGAAAEDPHFDLARIPKRGDLTPHLGVFAALADAEPNTAVMTSHCIVEAVDPSNPATFSTALVTDRLRGEIGFDGVVVSDDLEMGALDRYDFDRVVREVDHSGHDVLLICHSAEKHRIAHEVLAATDRDRSRDANIARRLDAFDPLTEAEPPLDDPRSLAAALATRAVTVVDDPQSLLPLAADTVWIAPRPGVEDDRCDPLRGESLDALSANVSTGTWFDYAPEPSSEDFVRLAPATIDAGTVVLVIAGVRESAARRDLLRQAHEWHPRLVVVLVGDPRDTEFIPAERRSTVVQAFGFRDVHQRALASALSEPARG